MKLFLPAAFLVGPTLGHGLLGIWMCHVMWRALEWNGHSQSEPTLVCIGGTFSLAVGRAAAGRDHARISTQLVAQLQTGCPPSRVAVSRASGRPSSAQLELERKLDQQHRAASSGEGKRAPVSRLKRVTKNAAVEASPSARPIQMPTAPHPTANPSVQPTPNPIIQ